VGGKLNLGELAAMSGTYGRLRASEYFRFQQLESWQLLLGYQEAEQFVATGTVN